MAQQMSFKNAFPFAWCIALSYVTKAGCLQWVGKTLLFLVPTNHQSCLISLPVRDYVYERCCRVIYLEARPCPIACIYLPVSSCRRSWCGPERASQLPYILMKCYGKIDRLICWLQTRDRWETELQQWWLLGEPKRNAKMNRTIYSEKEEDLITK